MPITVEQHVAEIHDRGYTIIPDALSPDDVSAARTALQSIFDRETPIAAERGWLTEMYRVSYLLPQKHALFRQFPLNPRVLGVARKVLGENCVLASLNGLTMTPGGEKQNLHIDAFESTPGVTMYINALHCLDDFTQANGCTRVVPGSHKRVWKRGCDWRAFDHEAIHLEAPSGSVIAYDGALVHGGSANTTDRPRRAVHAFYSRPWVFPQWDYRSSLTPDVVATLTPEQRKLFALDRFVPYYDASTDTPVRPTKKMWDL